MTTTTDGNRFSTLQAKFALLGHTLYQSGPANYFAERCGLVFFLYSFDEAEKILVQIGGAA